MEKEPKVITSARYIGVDETGKRCDKELVITEEDLIIQEDGSMEALKKLDEWNK